MSLLSLALLSPETFAAPIVNGRLEDGFPEVVALGASFGENTFSACTGTLITPRIILTAAHCGADLPLELVVSLGVAFFAADITTAEEDDLIGFDGVVIHPDYVPLQNGINGTLGEHDLSVMILDSDAPVAPAWVRLDPLLPETTEGETVTSVGFGLTDSSASSDGLKRSAELVVDTLDDTFLISLVSGNPDGANICSGDSGGPQFHLGEDGQYEIWGVHSWGDVDCAYNSGSTRTDIDADWILDQIEATHGTRDLCVAAGRHEDGRCDLDRCPDDPDCVDPVAEEEGKAGCSHLSPARPTARGLSLLGLVLLVLGVRRRPGAGRSSPRAGAGGRRG